MRWIKTIPILLLLTASALARADTLSEARALYKQGQYAKAVEKYGEAAKESPSDPAVYWNLGFAYRKLGKTTEALAAFEKAGKLDPTHSFASGPGKYEQTVAATRRPLSASGKEPALSAGEHKQATADLSRIPEVAAFKKGTVYVQEPNWARVNTAYLTDLSAELRRTHGTKFYFLVSASAYKGRQLARYAATVYGAAKLDNAFLLAASRLGVVAISGPAAKPVVSIAPSKSTNDIRTGDVAGTLEQLARGLVK